jgi:hypothetical protein
MSADNWAKCPRCKARLGAEIARRGSEVEASYGQVPAAEYGQAVSDLAEMATTPLEATFREDYEIYGADEGTVVVSYSGFCEVCRLTLTFKSETPIPDVDAPATGKNRPAR